jgi:hypothetical protein
MRPKGICDMKRTAARGARDLMLIVLLACVPAAASAAGFRLTAEGNAQDFGFSVAAAGDVNGDHVPDLIVGAPSYDGIQDFAGRAYVFFGPFAGDRSAADADATISAVNFGDNLGFSVASAGDTNGDGFDDLLVGARSNDAPGIQAGQVYLFRGPVYGDLHERRHRGDLGRRFRLGRAVAGVGDSITTASRTSPSARRSQQPRPRSFTRPGQRGAHDDDADVGIDGTEFNELPGRRSRARAT